MKSPYEIIENLEETIREIRDTCSIPMMRLDQSIGKLFEQERIMKYLIPEITYRLTCQLERIPHIPTTDEYLLSVEDEIYNCIMQSLNEDDFTIVDVKEILFLYKQIALRDITLIQLDRGY